MWFLLNEMFVRGKKLNTSNVFILEIFFAVLEDVRLSYTNMFILKIPKKIIAFSHSSNIEFKYFMILYKNPHCFLAIDTTLTSNNPLCIRENLLERI